MATRYSFSEIRDLLLQTSNVANTQSSNVFTSAVILNNTLNAADSNSIKSVQGGLNISAEGQVNIIGDNNNNNPDATTRLVSFRHGTEYSVNSAEVAYMMQDGSTFLLGNGSGNQTVLSILNSNMVNANAINFTIGKSQTTSNTANIRYVHSGGWSNYLGIGFWGADDKLNVLANGNVGVGTTTPTEKLHVAGNVFATGLLSVTGTANPTSDTPVEILNNTLTNDTRLNMRIGKLKSTNNTSHIRYTHKGDGFSTNYLGIGFWGSEDSLNVVANGLVGVGLSNPSQKLHVIGNILASGSITPNSDDRIKTDEAFIENATATLNKLRPQTYTKWASIEMVNDTSDSNVPPPYKESGLIAQEIFYDAPELRHLIVLPNDADSNAIFSSASNIASSTDPALDPAYLTWGTQPAAVNYIGLIGYLVKAVQEKDAQIVTIQARLSNAGI